MKRQVSRIILKNLKIRVLACLSIDKKWHFYKKNIGFIKQVLIENFEDGFLYGHTDNYIPVKILGKPNEVNEIIPVKFIQIEEGKMIGERPI